jgi:type VI secretion system protein ImpH
MSDTPRADELVTIIQPRRRAPVEVNAAEPAPASPGQIAEATGEPSPAVAAAAADAAPAIEPSIALPEDDPSRSPAERRLLRLARTFAVLQPLIDDARRKAAARAAAPPMPTEPVPPLQDDERLQAWGALQARLGTEPWAHDLFQLLRWVEALHPRLPRLGRALRPRDEPLRVGQDPELGFAPATVHSFGQLGPLQPAYAGVRVRVPPLGAAMQSPTSPLQAQGLTDSPTLARYEPAVRRRDPGVPRVGQQAFGLFGPMGPMPLHLTEVVRDRLRHEGDATPLAFADLFQHRAALLFYRAWAQAQPTCHRDRPQADDFGRWLAALAGLGQPALQGRDAVHDHAKRLHTGTLARGTRHAEGLVAILTQYLGLPVRLEPYVGHWLDLGPAERLRLQRPAGPLPRLGDARPAAGAPARPGLLGVSAAAGARVWDRQSRFRLHLGPLTLAQYDSLLPGRRGQAPAPALRALRDWVRLYAGLAVSCELRLVLAGESVPPARLGVVARRGRPALQGARLGRSSWLPQRLRAPQGEASPATPSVPPDRGDLHFLLEAAG